MSTGYSHKLSCSGSCNVFVYDDSVIPLNYWILVIKCIMLALERGSLRYNAPEAVVFHPALFIQFWAHLWLIKFPPFADNTSPVLASHAISPPLSWHFMAIDGLVNGQSEKTFHLHFPWNLCGFSPSLLPGRWFTGWSCILDWKLYLWKRWLLTFWQQRSTG